MLVVARRMALSLLCLTAATFAASVARAQDPNGCPAPCEPRWHSEAWWQARAQEPVGARQLDCKGKQWPPYNRPVGPEAPWCHIYHAEHYWPWPYMCTDRQYIFDVVRTQEANGWLTETTLYDYHFNAETHELTVPGKIQLKWILENVPPSYRTVWVQQAEDPAVSEQRINNVRAFANRLVNPSNMPQIAFRPALAPGARPSKSIRSVARNWSRSRVRGSRLNQVPPTQAAAVGVASPIEAESTRVPRQTARHDGVSGCPYAARSGNAFS